MSDRWPWRYRCPEGHTSLRMNSHTFHCEPCDRLYRKDRLVDKALRAQP